MGTSDNSEYEPCTANSQPLKHCRYRSLRPNSHHGSLQASSLVPDLQRPWHPLQCKSWPTLVTNRSLVKCRSVAGPFLCNINSVLPLQHTEACSNADRSRALLQFRVDTHKHTHRHEKEGTGRLLVQHSTLALHLKAQMQINANPAHGDVVRGGAKGYATIMVEYGALIQSPTYKKTQVAVSLASFSLW